MRLQRLKRTTFTSRTDGAPLRACASITLRVNCCWGSSKQTSWAKSQRAAGPCLSYHLCYPSYHLSYYTLSYPRYHPSCRPRYHHLSYPSYPSQRGSSFRLADFDTSLGVPVLGQPRTTLF